MIGSGTEVEVGNKIQILMIGVGGIGKSSLTRQYVDGSFCESYDPLEEEESQKIIQINGKSVTVEIIN